MKLSNIASIPRTAFPRTLPVPTTQPQSQESEWSLQSILIGLMVPAGMTTLSMSMFGVALPAIRAAFSAAPDLVAWIVTAYSLPFVIFMPIYGKLSDGLGKAKLFMIGITLFFIGSFVCLLAENLSFLLLGRALQGIGTAGINPLCIAIISDLFPAEERGKAMGTWSSMAPAAAMFGPLLGGVFVDYLGWNFIFIPSLVAALIALYVVYRQIPAMEPERAPGFFRGFDWMGMLLLSSTMITFIFYMSSRLITGVAPLQDWRLLLGSLFLLTVFILWERWVKSPLVNLKLYQRRNFGVASLSAGMRMFMMGGMGIITVLYLTDIHHLSAGALGIFATCQAGCILATVRLGGQLSDKWSSRWVVLTSVIVQLVAIFAITYLPANVSLAWVVAFLLLQSIGAGLALAALHGAAMCDIPHAESGAAAGLYSMSRFGGGVIGSTLAGVVLQQAQSTMETQIDAYQMTFGFIGVVSILSILIALRLQHR